MHFVDLTPSSFRAVSQARQQIRMWIGVYASTAAVLAGCYLLVNAGRSQRLSERETLASQLKLEWDRNEEAKKLLTQYQRLDGDITRYDRLASPVRVSDVVGTVAAILPPRISLTAITLTPRQEKLAPVAPAKPGAAQAAAAAAQPKPQSQLSVELEGVAPSDSDVSMLVSGLEASALFTQVAMDYARSVSIDGTPGRSFRVTCRVDLGRHYAFREESLPPAPAPAAGADAPKLGEAGGES